MNKFNTELKNLKIEDIIWVIYFFIATAAVISNYYERKNLFQTGKAYNLTSKKINVTIFIITLFIYLYFVYLNWQDLKEFQNAMNKKQTILNQARLIAALLFLIGGIIYLIAEIEDEGSIELGII